MIFIRLSLSCLLYLLLQPSTSFLSHRQTIPNHNLTSQCLILLTNRYSAHPAIPKHTILSPQELFPHKPSQPLGYSLFSHTWSQKTIPSSNTMPQSIDYSQISHTWSHTTIPCQSFLVTEDHSHFKHTRSHTTIPCSQARHETSPILLVFFVLCIDVLKCLDVFLLCDDVLLTMNNSTLWVRLSRLNRHLA